jgi:hypothetical protein
MPRFWNSGGWFKKILPFYPAWVVYIKIEIGIPSKGQATIPKIA